MAEKTRATWEQVPERVRQALEKQLGSPVVSAVKRRYRDATVRWLRQRTGW